MISWKQTIDRAPHFWAAIPAIIGGASKLAGALSKGGNGQSGYTVPPEEEIQMLGKFQNSLANIDQMYKKNQQMLSTFNQRINYLTGLEKGTMPSQEALQGLQQTTQNIAEMFGGNALEAIKNGFLDKTSAKYSGLISEREGQIYNAGQEDLNKLRSADSQNFEDPALKHQQEDQRRQLLQNLQRQGASPAAQQAALAQFDRQSQDQSFQRSNDLRNQMYAQVQARTGIGQSLLGGSTGALNSAYNIDYQGQQQQFNQAQQGYNIAQGQLTNAQNTMGQLAQLYSQQFNAGQQSTQLGATLNQQPLNMFQQLGQFKLSGGAKNLLSNGIIGPGQSQPYNAGQYKQARSFLTQNNASLQAKQAAAQQSSSFFNAQAYNPFSPQSDQNSYYGNQLWNQTNYADNYNAPKNRTGLYA